METLFDHLPIYGSVDLLWRNAKCKCEFTNKSAQPRLTSTAQNNQVQNLQYILRFVKTQSKATDPTLGKYIDYYEWNIAFQTQRGVCCFCCRGIFLCWSSSSDHLYYLQCVHHKKSLLLHLSRYYEFFGGGYTVSKAWNGRKIQSCHRNILVSLRHIIRAYSSG